MTNMAKLSTRRRNGTLVVEIQPSLDHPEEPAICLHPGESIRIHNTNGGYLFSLVADKNGRVTEYQDGLFYGGSEHLYAHTLVPWIAKGVE